jgi:3-hydroxyisobutyrate dehydrogenase
MSTTLGVIGMGRMGSHMAARLLTRGQLVVYDRSPEKSRAMAHAGALVAETPADLAALCDVVLVSVTDDVAMDQVMFGPHGALSGLLEGSLIIDLSTVSPRASRRLHEAAAERGAAMIDAAVSGSVPQVEQGTLVIFVGGDRDAYERARPILEALGQHIFHMGSSGMGTTMKLVVNTLLGCGMQALAEAIVLGESAGLDKTLLLDVLEQTAVLSPGQKSKLGNVKRDDYPTLFALSLMHKDLGLVVQQADELAVSMPTTVAAKEMSSAAMEQGMEADFSVIVRFMQHMNGVRES